MPFVNANGKRFFFYTEESPEPQPEESDLKVLAIHGLGSSHCFYLPVLEEIFAAGFICIAYDTYGSGLSTITDGGPGGENQDVESMAADALAIMAELGLEPERTVVMGHSMGGMVACHLASLRPFAGVVLLGPVHPTPAAAGAFARRIEIVSQQGMELMADLIPAAATGTRSTPTQQAWIRSLLLSQNPAGYISLCRVISNAVPPEYARIKSPVLLIAGEEDESAPLAGCKTILDSCASPSSSKALHVLEGVGHWHCVEAPEEVAKLCIEFLDKLDD